jgi:hypothetical protein
VQPEGVSAEQGQIAVKAQKYRRVRRARRHRQVIDSRCSKLGHIPPGSARGQGSREARTAAYAGMQLPISVFANPHANIHSQRTLTVTLGAPLAYSMHAHRSVARGRSPSTELWNGSKSSASQERLIRALIESMARCLLHLSRACAVGVL